MLLRNILHSFVLNHKLIIKSGNEIGPFRAIEESTLAQLTPPEMRSDVYAWYILIGTAGIAFGVMTSGWVVHELQLVRGWTNIEAYRLVFQAYAVFGLIKFCLAMALSKNVEAEKKRKIAGEVDPAARPLLEDSSPDGPDVKPAKKRACTSALPDISKESRIIVLNLCLLFALDSFASGLAPL